MLKCYIVLEFYEGGIMVNLEINVFKNLKNLFSVLICLIVIFRSVYIWNIILKILKNIFCVSIRKKNLNCLGIFEKVYKF